MAESLLIYLKIKAREKERFSRLGSRSVLDSSQSSRSPSDGRGKNIGKGPGVVASVPSSPARASFMVGTSPPPPPVQKPPSPAPTTPLKQSPQQQHLQAGDGGSRNSPLPGGPIGDRAESNSSLAGYGANRKPGSRSHNPSPTSTQTARDLR